jgi:hypothetical protein
MNSSGDQQEHIPFPLLQVLFFQVGTMKMFSKLGKFCKKKNFCETRVELSGCDQNILRQTSWL